MDTKSGQTADQLLRETIRRGIRFCRSKSREQICEALSLRVGRNISVETLHKWASENEAERRLPADCVLALSEILRDDTLQRAMLSEPLKQVLELGEWLLNSTWVLDEVKVRVGKSVVRKLKGAIGHRKGVAA